MLKTTIALVALSLLATASIATAAPAGKLLWKSPAPTGVVYDSSGVPIEDCYATIRLVTDKDGSKHRMRNDMECLTPGIHNYVSMSFPADGPPINMKGIKEATHVRVLPSGVIQLY